MSQEQVLLLVDDLDNRSANYRETSVNIQTVAFAIDMGNGLEHYEIELGSANANKLRKALAEYIECGRVVSVPKPEPKGRHRKNIREDNAAIRQWGLDHGHDVPARGRIPLRVIAEYDAARNAETVVTTARQSKKGKRSHISLAS